MVPERVNKPDSRVRDTKDTPNPWLRGCVVITKSTGRILVNAFADDAAAWRSRPLCAMLCAMHSLAGGTFSAPRCTLRLDGFSVTTQESREGTIVAVLADPTEHDTRAVQTVTRIVARNFSIVSRNALPGVIMDDLFETERNAGVDDNTNDPNNHTIDTFAKFHANYLLPKVLAHPKSTTLRWLSEIAHCEDVIAAHVFLSLFNEETEEEDSYSFDSFEASHVQENSAISISPAASWVGETTRNPLAVLCGPVSGSAVWAAVAKRATEMIENVSKRLITHTETITFDPTADRSTLLTATLHVFGDDNESDAACVVAFSTVTRRETNREKEKVSKGFEGVAPALVSAFARSRVAVLADIAPPPPDVFASCTPSLPYIIDNPIYDDLDSKCSPMSPLSLSDAEFEEEEAANYLEEEMKNSTAVPVKPSAPTRNRTFPRFSSRARVHPIDESQVSVDKKRR